MLRESSWSSRALTGEQEVPETLTLVEVVVVWAGCIFPLVGAAARVVAVPAKIHQGGRHFLRGSVAGWVGMQKLGESVRWQQRGPEQHEQCG